MNARSATALALKVTGIVLLPRAFAVLPHIASSVAFVAASGATEGKARAYLALVVPSLILLCFTLTLVLLAEPIARRLVPGDDAEIALDVDAKTMHVLAFSILGAVLIAKGLPDVVRGILHCWIYSEKLGRDVGGEPAIVQKLIGVVPAVITLLLGLFLFLRADGLHNLWTKLRKADGIQES
jgi:hypothetical protein